MLSFQNMVATSLTGQLVSQSVSQAINKFISQDGIDLSVNHCEPLISPSVSAFVSQPVIELVSQ